MNRNAPERRPARVHTPHQRSYEVAMLASKGDVVRRIRSDPDAPGWTWCEHIPTGVASWVPDSFIISTNREAAFLARDYSAIELTVSTGEEIDAGEKVAGWTWCRNAAGNEGWVPDTSLADAPSSIGCNPLS